MMSGSQALLNVYKKIGPVFVRGQKSFLWDERGRKYLDLFPGWGVGILGHSHPRIVKVIKEQASRLIFLPNNLQHQWQTRLAQQIVRVAFPSRVFFANSGAEAIESAIKFSRLYGKGKRYEIIAMKNSFHGRTLGAVSVTGQKKYRDPFKPLVRGCLEARFNDIKDLRRKVNTKTVAVLLEPIQGEGGVNVADFQYLREVNAFCKKHDILLILDEVQTGMGRTAKFFCYQHYGIVPDIMTLAKGLGAGFPVSCMVVKKDIADLMKPGHHASTFGGNPLATRVGLEVFHIIQSQQILTHAQAMSRHLFKRLSDMKKEFKIIRAIRGIGLMAGIECSVKTQPIFEAAFRNRLIINATHENVLRIMPALTVEKKDLDDGLDILTYVLKRFR